METCLANFTSPKTEIVFQVAKVLHRMTGLNFQMTQYPCERWPGFHCHIF